MGGEGGILLVFVILLLICLVEESSLYSIFKQLFTVASRQGALYFVVGNNAMGSTFAAGYRISINYW